MSTVPENTSAKLEQVAIVGSQSDATAPRTKRWTRDEYYRLYEAGWFRGERVELIQGEIILISPQSPEHYQCIERIRRLLVQLFGDGYWVRMQGPIRSDNFSEPEPDLCVVRGEVEDFKEHPSSAQLVIEVSKTSLDFDVSEKSSIYASMNVPEYWVLDLDGRRLIVHRQPFADEQARFGYRYDEVIEIGADGHVSPLEKPDAQLAVAEMLPPLKPDATKSSTT